MASVDLARFLAGGQLRAVAGGGEDRPQPAAGGVDARGQVALRDELQLDLARLVRGVEVPRVALPRERADHFARSEEHTSELQSLMRISYAVFGLKTKK